MATKDYVYSVAAGALRTDRISGQYARVISQVAGSPTNFLLRLEQQLQQQGTGGQTGTSNFFLLGTMALGLQAGPTPFVYDTVTVDNTAGATTLNVTISFGDTPIEDNRLVGQVLITGGISLAGAGVNQSYGQVVAAANAATAVWAALSNGDNNGKIQNIGAHDVWVGYDNAVTAATGMLLPAGTVDGDSNQPGAFLDGLSSKLNLFVFAAAGAASRVSFMQQGN